MGNNSIPKAKNLSPRFILKVHGLNVKLNNDEVIKNLIPVKRTKKVDFKKVL